MTDDAGSRLAALIVRKGRRRYYVAQPDHQQHEFATVHGACLWAIEHVGELLDQADRWRAETRAS